jgi:uncharacterized membrane protein YdfJ with MMPL/SSD domain
MFAAVAYLVIGIIVLLALLLIAMIVSLAVDERNRIEP